MELKDIKQGEIYFTRVSHIRAFRTHFPQVDSSKIVSFEVIKKPVIDTSELLIELKPFNGEEHLNPRTRNGYWYIEAFNFNYIYSDTQDLAAGDCPNFKHFIIFKYLDPELPQDEYYVQVDVADHFKFVKGDIMLISSQSTDFRFVRVVRRQSLVNTPYGAKPSYNHILSNVEIAKIFRAKKINKYMFNKCEAIRRAYEDGVLAGEIRERESASTSFNTDEIISTIVDLKTRLNNVENSAEQLQKDAATKIKELTEHIRKLEALNTDQAETIKNGWKEKEDLEKIIERLRSCVRHLLDQKQASTEIKTGPQRLIEELSKPMDPVLAEVLQENAKLTEAVLRLTLELNQYKK